MTEAKSTASSTRNGGGSRARGGGVSARQGGVSTREGGKHAREEGNAALGYVTEVKQALRNVEVSNTSIRRGLKLYQGGRVIENRHYPWIFMVTGDIDMTAGGSSLYRIDLTVPTCSCAFHRHTQQICKHIVAASCKFREREGL